MKQIVRTVLLLATTLLAGAAFAQQNPPPGEGGQQGQPVLEDQRTQMQALMKDDSLSQDDRRSKGRSIRESTDSKIRDVLTDDQKKKYDAWQQEMRDRMRQRQQGGDNPPPPK